MIKKAPKYKVFIGYDPSEDLDWKICSYSIKKHCSIPLEIIELRQQTLRSYKLYDRTDTQASNEFSITRFLVPYLSGFKGYSIFLDCDFIVRCDLKQIFDQIDNNYAVKVVKHDYISKASTKMGGRIQHSYPKKNWSSMILWQNGHELNKILKPDFVNKATPQFLHRFEWLNESKDIGAMPTTYNYLVGEYSKRESIDESKCLHFTLGSPIYKESEQCDYSEVWYQYKQEMTDNPKFENKLVKEVRLKDTIIWANDRAKAKDGDCGCS